MHRVGTGEGQVQEKAHRLKHLEYLREVIPKYDRAIRPQLPSYSHKILLGRVEYESQCETFCRLSSKFRQGHDAIDP